MTLKPGKTSPATNELPPVRIPNLFAPRPGDTQSDGGVGVRHVEHDLEVLLKRPESAIPGTFIRLFWHNPMQAVAQMVVKDEHLNDDFFVLRAPAFVIRPPWADLVYCSVTPPNANTMRTVPLKLRVSLNRPGGRDPDQDTPGNQAFTFNLPPDIAVTMTLDDERARRGVAIEIQPYLHMAEFDQCVIAWGSEQVTHQVTAAEVGNSLFITVDYATILKAGDNDDLPIAMQVIDAVGNKPDLYEQWSATQRLNVTLTTDLLEPPFLPDGESIIDLDKLAGESQEVQIYASRTDFEVNDELLLVWDGRDADGFHIPHTELIKLDRVGRVLSFFVPNATVAAIAEGTATVSYTLRKNTPAKQKKQLLRHSRKLSLEIVGEYIPWPAPDVLEDLPDGYLDPNLPFATVVFRAQPGWQPEHWLSVTWTARRGDSTLRFTQERQVGELPEDGMFEFIFNAPDIKSFIGLITAIRYELRDKQSNPDYRRESLPLFIRVGDLITGLEEPIIHLVRANWLNPDAVPHTGATGEVPYLDTEDGDKITLYWQGATEELSFSIEIDINADTAGKAAPFTLPRSLVVANIDRSVSVVYKLEREGQEPRFSETLYVLIEKREPILSEDFNSYAQRLIGPGEYLSTPSMAVYNLTGVALCGLTGYFVANSFRSGISIGLSYNTHAPTPQQHVRLVFSFPYRYVRFAFSWIHYAAEVHYFDGKLLLERRDMKGEIAGGLLHEWVEFQAPAGRVVTHIEVVTTDYSFLDNFTFRV